MSRAVGDAAAPEPAGAASAADAEPSPHPGPSSVVLPPAIRDALIEHARAEYPNEACGLIVGSAPAADAGRALRFVPTRNAAASPYRYEIHPDDLLRVSLAVDEADQAIWGIVHSHVRSPARPSPTDLGLAFYPDALYLLVSLADSEADPSTGLPGVRAWRIVDGAANEVTLRVEAAAP
ncbi:MAG TPA: M67 family metallopeptidase [Candidatus Limnocylindrales bacterium]